MSKANDNPPAWTEALEYFRSRKSVLFISYCRFWERHGFVQQALAHELAASGVEVTWFDGSGWRPYHPVIVNPAEKLTVLQLPQVPLRRFSFVSHWDRALKSRFLKSYIKKMPGRPVIWIQAGVDEGVAADLPYIDIFSVFDDPYRHSPLGELCRKAEVIVCQNHTAKACLNSIHASKTFVQLPPVDMSDSSMEGKAEVFLPFGFPSQIMGYVGSFFTDGFDLELFEDFIQSFPAWGFVLMGRTDENGLKAMQRWKHQYKNFHYFPWVPRNQVASVWKKLRLTLLFYRPNRTQDGAFPIKIVEGLRFGVPCIATEVPKTGELEGAFPRSKYREELKASVEKALEMKADDLRMLYERFAKEMSPKLHLARVAQWLQQ